LKDPFNLIFSKRREKRGKWENLLPRIPSTAKRKGKGSSLFRQEKTGRKGGPGKHPVIFLKLGEGKKGASACPIEREKGGK